MSGMYQMRGSMSQKVQGRLAHGERGGGGGKKSAHEEGELVEVIRFRLGVGR